MGKTAYEEPLGILRRNTDRILRRSIGGRRQAATVADASCCASRQDWNISTSHSRY